MRIPEFKDCSRRIVCRLLRPGALVILYKIQVMSRSDPEALAMTDTNGAEVSIPSTPSDEMSTDVNRRDLALTTGDHRAMQTPMNIMSLNTTIVPPNQGNLEPQSELFDRMWEKISNTIMMQAQGAMRHQWQLCKQSSHAHQQAQQQNLEIAVQNERASNYTQQRQQLIHCENIMQEMSTEMATKENRVRHAAEMYHQAAAEQMTQRVTEEKE